MKQAAFICALAMVLVPLRSSAFIYFASPRSGHVSDLVTNRPLEKANLTRSVSYRHLVNLINAVDGSVVFKETPYFERVSTDGTGAYSFPGSYGFMLGYGVEEQICVWVDGAKYFDGCTGVHENWSSEIKLVPIVSDRAECQGNPQCLERNERAARGCLIDGDKSSPLCSAYEKAGWSRLFTTERDFQSCVVLPDREAIRCILTRTRVGGFSREGELEPRSVADRTSCAIFGSELPRNFCYLLSAKRAKYPRADCEMLTDKQVPSEWLADKGQGVEDDWRKFFKDAEGRVVHADFRSICMDRAHHKNEWEDAPP